MIGGKSVATRVGTSGRVAGVNGGAAREEGMGEGGAAVVLERAEIGINAQ